MRVRGKGDELDSRGASRHIISAHRANGPITLMACVASRLCNCVEMAVYPYEAGQFAFMYGLDCRCGRRLRVRKSCE